MLQRRWVGDLPGHRQACHRITKKDDDERSKFDLGCQGKAALPKIGDTPFYDVKVYRAKLGLGGFRFGHPPRVVYCVYINLHTVTQPKYLHTFPKMKFIPLSSVRITLFCL